tara:strand:+ start:2299 stop:3450 length:1152 start_codon:yes stop_codon:yes gene_type:complete
MKSLVNYYGLQDFTNTPKDIIKKIIKLNIVTNGKYCISLEKKISKLVGSKYSVVCNNGTSALMMAILSLKLKNIVAIIPNINFVASASILSLIKAKFIFCDVNFKTGMVDTENFKEVLLKCDKQKIKPNLFLPMHYAGNIIDLKKISKICKKKSIKIIEDGCHSFGSLNYKQNKKSYLGDCKFSEMTTFSFHPVKNITTFEGGAITLNNKSLYQRILNLRSHSLVKTNITDPYQLDSPSLNFRMSEISALVGIDQIKKINYFKKKRNLIVKYYLSSFKYISEKFECLNFYDANIFWHLFVIKLNSFNNRKKLKFMKYLKKNQIGCQIHYKPLYKHKVYKKNMLFSINKNSDKFYKSIVTLPLHTLLKKKDLIYISNKVKNFFK